MAWLASAPALAQAPAAADTTSAPVVVAVRFGGDATGTRVVIDLARKTGAPTLYPEGARLNLDFASGPDESLEGGRGRGLVKDWTLVPGPRGERLRLDLAAGVKVARRFFIPPSEGASNYRYVLDLAPDTPPPVAALQTVVATTPPPVRLAAAPILVTSMQAASLQLPLVQTHSPPPPQPRARVERRLKVIVVDAGHGGHDSGAVGASRSEKDLTLAAALALKSRLERTGRYKVVLTRDTDVFIPLEARVKIAREGGADLFLSLHVDSAGADAATHGASVYTLSDSGGGRVHYVLGHDEWFTKVATRTDAGVGRILLDLTQRSTRNRSAVFAGLLLDKLAGRVDLLPRSHRDAGYFVLLAPDVPAALLEMGFITNPEDETRLADPARRSRMMEGVAEAIDAYFDQGRVVVAG